MHTLILLQIAAILGCARTSIEKDPGSGGGGGETGQEEETGSSDPDDTGPEPPLALKLQSDSFADGSAIPLRHVCAAHGGSNISPHLEWAHGPAASSYSIIMDDEVSPCGTADAACRHWALFNIPASQTTFSEDLDASTIDGLAVGQNYSGAASYAGPCPPNAHVYKTTIYALSDSMPAIDTGAAYTRSMFESEYAESILSQDTIEGTFDPSD